MMTCKNVNVSTLMCIFFCGCNLKSYNGICLDSVLYYFFKSNLLTFCSVFVLYSLFKREKINKSYKITKKATSFISV